jgi:hypothetical protein
MSYSRNNEDPADPVFMGLFIQLLFFPENSKCQHGQSIDSQNNSTRPLTVLVGLWTCSPKWICFTGYMPAISMVDHHHFAALEGHLIH